MLASFFLVLVAATPPPPAALIPYVRDGRLEPGDYRWLRGGFDGADETEVAAYREIVEWRRRCRARDMMETRAELAELGVSAGASIDTIPYRTLVCDQVATLPEPLDLGDWTGFARDVAIVRPIAQAFLTAVSAAEGAAALDSPDLRDGLNARKTGEQTLRFGLLWASGSSMDGVSAMELTPRQRGILVSEFAIALATRDHANTGWLKVVVGERGWPRRSQVGASAAAAAWLLIQHADADPAFQVRALRLMEPLVSNDEVDRRNYAYLYDRVMLKVAGRQRYATQLTCRGGRFVPQALDDERNVDARRREMGMATLADHQALALRKMGPCQEPPSTN